jgi:hypothetical protein
VRVVLRLVLLLDLLEMTVLIPCLQLLLQLVVVVEAAVPALLT